MEKPTTHQSQIRKTNDGYEIEIDSSLKLLSNEISPISMIITIFISIIGSVTVQAVAQIAFVLLIIQIFIYLIKDHLFTNVLIHKTQIKQDDKLLVFSNFQYLDLNIKAIDNTIKVEIGNIHFKLNNAADIPILTDAIKEVMNFEFYENRQLSDKSEVLTFKAKNITKPNFWDLSIITESPDLIQVTDRKNRKKWLLFQMKNKQFLSFPINNGHQYQPIYYNTIKKIEIITEYRSSFNKRVIEFRILVIKNTDEHFIAFQSNLRQAKDELTNLRDVEKLYKILRKLPLLTNVEIEKRFFEK